MAMMRDQIHVKRIGIIRGLGLSSSFTKKNSISYQSSLSIPRVKKVSLSRRHQSLRIQPRHPSVKETTSKGVIHVTVRSLTNSVRPTENNLDDIHEHLHLNSTILAVQHHRNRSITSIDNQKSVDSIKTTKHSVNINDYNRQNRLLKQSCSDRLKNDFLHEDLQQQNNCSSKTGIVASEYQKYNHRKTISAKKYSLTTTNTAQFPDVCNINLSRFDNGSGFANEKNAARSHRRSLTNERNQKTRKKRKCLGSYCCACTPLCAFLSLFAAGLLAAAIAALLIALIKPSNTSSSTTTSTTTSEATTTTTSEATTTTTSEATTTTTSESTTTTTSSISTTTYTTSTSTTTARPIIQITRSGDTTMGLYNTSAGGPTGASNGIYANLNQEPDAAIDGSTSTKYLNFGFQGYNGAVLNNPGVNTGFYVTPNISNASVALGLLFATGNDYPTRDPITVTLEGTNATGTASLNLGSSWTLIYSGPTGIDPLFVPPRSTYVPPQNFSNTMVYKSYRLLVTSQRNLTDCVQYAEAQIIGYV